MAAASVKKPLRTQTSAEELHYLTAELKLAVQDRMEQTCFDAIHEIDMTVSMALRMLPPEFRKMSIGQALEIGVRPDASSRSWRPSVVHAVIVCSWQAHAKAASSQDQNVCNVTQRLGRRGGRQWQQEGVAKKRPVGRQTTLMAARKISIRLISSSRRRAARSSLRR
eukprot:TRINITY_DN14263_c0_g1_i2.p1 TRINITY_DN14263_c0_g1~~TRINITY_DN14263_c0_g1_i2.p1  ORF type:complete len:167 (+),score=23.87 TRINITY_DN14263_c0_g1_i2:81-581(+)